MNQNYQTWWIPEINLLEPHKEKKTYQIQIDEWLDITQGAVQHSKPPIATELVFS